MKNFRTATATVALAATLFMGFGLTGCQSGSSGEKLPDGVPSEVQPVPGAVVNKASASDTNWSFSVDVDDESAQQDALKKLKDDGFTVRGKNEAEKAKTYSLSKDKINVTIVMTKIGDQHVVIYNIVKI